LKSLHLLLSSDGNECEALAQELEEHNVARRELERRILDEASTLVQRDVDLSRDLAIVLAGSGWHGGVLGLVASRLAERHSRPAIVLNMDGDSASGSGRSACGFDLHSAVEATRDIITRGGGHQAACGMTVPASRFEEFRARVLQCVAQSLTIDDSCRASKPIAK
jgi:single-stranded-DNA-specific exonuclease